MSTANDDQQRRNDDQQARNVDQQTRNVIQQSANVQQGCDDEQNVVVKRWIVKLAEMLLVFLAIGAVSTVITLLLWIFSLNEATRKILDNQSQSRKAIQESQQEILDAQKENREVLEDYQKKTLKRLP